MGLLDHVPTSPDAGAPMSCTPTTLVVSQIAFAYAIRESVRAIVFKEGAHCFHHNPCTYNY
jgi:hypothetical protein